MKEDEQGNFVSAESDWLAVLFCFVCVFVGGGRVWVAALAF